MPIGFFPKIQERFFDYQLFFYRPILDYQKERYELLKFPEIIEVNNNIEFPDDCGIRMDKEGLQLLMDALWRLGIRPKEGHGSTGQLAATEQHLNAITQTHDRLLKMIEAKWNTPPWGG